MAISNFNTLSLSEKLDALGTLPNDVFKPANWCEAPKGVYDLYVVNLELVSGSSLTIYGLPKGSLNVTKKKLMCKGTFDTYEVCFHLTKKDADELVKFGFLTIKIYTNEQGEKRFKIL